MERAGGRIARYLEEREAVDPEAARTAGQRIAAAWAAREFWWAATAEPLTAACRRSPSAAPVPELIQRLAREFNVFIRPQT